jgi:uncharacterized protein
MCTLAFKGYGYSKSFIENYQEIINQLPGVEIKVVEGLDQICSACPEQTKQGECIKQRRVSMLDAKHMEVLGIKIGQVLTWNKAVEKIKEKMSIEKFEYACQECSWKPYGICKDVLLQLVK